MSFEEPTDPPQIYAVRGGGFWQYDGTNAAFFEAYGSTLFYTQATSEENEDGDLIVTITPQQVDLDNGAQPMTWTIKRGEWWSPGMPVSIPADVWAQQFIVVPAVD
jgi:hypothetical protein